LGAWNGLTRDEIMARWPAEFEARTEGDLSTVPGGEAGDHFVKRCVAALGRVVARGADEGLVVTHGGAVIALEMALGAWAPDRRRTNLSGWWLESRGAPHDSGLVLLEWVDLLAMSAETVTGPG
jgi:broad specificity phosphatase PhoE